MRVRTLDLEASRDEAERANRVNAEFMATISHELRTPMNGVIVMIELLQHSGVTAEQFEMLGLANDSAESLLQIIDRMLDFLQLEQDTLELACEPFSVGAVVADAFSLVAATGRSKSVTLSSNLAQGTHEVILGDAFRLRQVLVHVLSNAVKFSSTDGRVAHVLLPGTARQEHPASPMLDLEIEDNGVGMDSQALRLPVRAAFSSRFVNPARSSRFVSPSTQSTAFRANFPCHLLSTPRARNLAFELPRRPRPSRRSGRPAAVFSSWPQRTVWATRRPSRG